MNRPMTDLERVVSSILCIIGGGLAVVAIGLAIVNGPTTLDASEGVFCEEHEQRILELERSLSMYTNAEAVIVIRDDGACGLRWFDAGARLGCGTSWVRYRLPAAGGGTVTHVEGAVPR